MKRPVFERWGNAVLTCNYKPFKRVTGERERSRAALPCGRSVCSRCKEACVSRPTFSYSLNPAV
jgi:hypothetical protein